MPHFDAHGNGTWICQKCATIRPDTTKAHCRPDINHGNICGSCVKLFDAGKDIPKPTTQTIAYDVPEYEQAVSPPISLHDHCCEESGGLTGTALDRYINHYYGHG